MKTENRVFGNNLRVFLYKAGLSVEEFSRKLGYTEYETYKIMDARAYISLRECQQIADFLNKPLEEFYKVLTNKEYEAAGCIECRGSFSRPENKRLILDIFDLYCDAQEALEC